MAALASYARQAEDETLLKTAMRIQGRAVRRAGELLREFDGQGRRTDQLTEGAHSKLTQRDAAQASGMSPHQQVQDMKEPDRR